MKKALLLLVSVNVLFAVSFCVFVIAESIYGSPNSDCMFLKSGPCSDADSKLYSSVFVLFGAAAVVVSLNLIALVLYIIRKLKKTNQKTPSKRGS